MNIEEQFRNEINKNVDYVIKHIWLKWNVEDIRMMMMLLGTYENLYTPTDWYWCWLWEYLENKKFLTPTK